MFDKVIPYGLVETKMKKLLLKVAEEQLVKGYELGFEAGLAAAERKGCILGGVRIREQIDKIMRDKGL